MGDSWRTWPRPGDDDLMDFTWGTDCNPGNEWCFTYREPHEHGFACDKTCRCKTERERWSR